MNDDFTLRQARDWTRERAAKGVDCPCCRQTVKVHRRKLNGSMCRALLAFYRHGGREAREWSNFSETLTADGIAYRGADYSKLAYWGLLETNEKYSGVWRVTELGVHFIQLATTVPSHAVMYNRRFMRVDGDPIGIIEALGKKFDYWELMREQPKSGEPE